MEERFLFGVEIDVCPACEGVFLDPGEAEARGIETHALFGGGEGSASPVGPSQRPCPAHGEPMTTYRVELGRLDGVLEIERAGCCGGFFLDAGEDRQFARAARRAAQLAAQQREVRASGKFVLPPWVTEDGAGPTPLEAIGQGIAAAAAGADAADAPVADPPVPVEPKGPAADGRRCPRCGVGYRADRQGDTEIDLCPSCGSMFLDLSALDGRGVNTAALFGVGPEAAQDLGASELDCPRCAETMKALRVVTLAGAVVVDRATCCGGLFLDGGEYDPFVRAARRAETYAADREFEEKGEVAGEEAILQRMAGEEGAEVEARFVRARVDGMVLEMMRQRQTRGRKL